MWHKVKVSVKTEKKGLFGKKEKVENVVIKVDDKTYRRMKRESEPQPLTLDEIALLDAIFGD